MLQKYIFFADKKHKSMVKVYQFLATGFEETEALAPMDILRRGGVDVQTVSVTGTDYVESSHRVIVKADVRFEEADLSDADLLMIPGGMPGASNLNAHPGVREALLNQFKSGRRVSAICAAPMVLGSIGILKGKRATCYPGFEKYLDGAEYTRELCTVDDTITTGKGPAAAFVYGFCLLAQLTSEELAQKVKTDMLIDELKAHS